MLSEVRQKNYRKIKLGPKMLNFGASKPRVKAPLSWNRTCHCIGTILRLQI